VRRISKDIEKCIIEDYKNNILSNKEIATKYKIHYTSIYRVINRNNISKFKNSNGKGRLYNRDDNYFKIIDTYDKAYFLGLMFSDGCVYPEQNQIIINLKENDKDILLKFKEYIKYTGNLFYIKSQKQYRLQIRSFDMCNDLIDKGCVKRKSLILKPPNHIPNTLIRHFIRGYLDGDGSIGLYKRPNNQKLFSVVLLGTQYICDFIANEIKINLNINTNINKIKSIYRVAIYKKRDVIQFLNWIYFDTDLYLKRKYNIYLEMLDKIKEYDIS
jgi:predicted DNA-binding protein YlxM (UPF0122 family)